MPSLVFHTRKEGKMSYFMVTSDSKDLCLNCGQWSEQEGVFVDFNDRPEGIRCEQCGNYFSKEKPVLI